MKNKKIITLSFSLLMGMGSFTSVGNAGSFRDILGKAFHEIEAGALEVEHIAHTVTKHAQEVYVQNPDIIGKLENFLEKGSISYLTNLVEKKLGLSETLINDIKSALSSSIATEIIEVMSTLIDDINDLVTKVTEEVSSLGNSASIKKIVSVLKIVESFTHKIQELKSAALSYGLIGSTSPASISEEGVKKDDVGTPPAGEASVETHS